jgi:hypothetical protein
MIGDRDPQATYRVAHIDDLYHVTTFFKAPEPTRTATYRFDVLPEWMQNCVRLIDVAGAGYQVAGVGHKYLDHVYWIVPLDEDAAEYVQPSLFVRT